MKNLYLIGNGFDIFTGLHTRYVDFKHWLEDNYPFVYENLFDAYEMNGEWWNDFEEQLGKLNVQEYMRKFTPKPTSFDEIMPYIDYAQECNFPQSLYSDLPCANRLRGLLDILQYCLEKWVDHCQKYIVNPKRTHLEVNDSYFINFNYTDVLQELYHIPDERVLHIHGRASRKDHLVFGHNSSVWKFENKITSADENELCAVLFQYQKNPYQYIYQHDKLPQVISNVSHVYVYGLSISPVDEDYLDWIQLHTPSDCQWEISWYTEKDKSRINNFIREHWGLHDRFRLVQLNSVEDA